MVGDAPMSSARSTSRAAPACRRSRSPRTPTTVVGVDVSPEMLRVGAARAGRALPARERGADAVRPALVRRGDVLLGRALVRPAARSSPSCTACCGPGGWVGLYDHYFIGEMVDVPEFARVARTTRSSATRCRRATRRSAIPRSLEPAGFEKIGDELFADDIEMTHERARRLPAHDQQLRRRGRAGRRPAPSSRRGRSSRPRRCSTASRPARSASSARSPAFAGSVD